MKTPICDFVKGYAESNALRLHMPGHKGHSYLGAEPYDITEIDGADVLYSADGIIKESEAVAASLFGTALTKYSAEGSSLAIRAMLYLSLMAAKSEGRRPLVAAGRNAHKVFMTAAALLDFDILWLYGEGGGLVSCRITPKYLEDFFASSADRPTAVYITSPDYLGNTADIKALAEVCHRHGVMLIVDNAHGAYLNFLPESRHPTFLGADMCCDSAHKTLPVLTGGAYLHISKNAPSVCCDMAESAMSLFASTSPSYLILQSLDGANRYILEGYKERLSETSHRVGRLKCTLTDHGYDTVGDEPIKLTLMPKSYGYTGDELAEILLSENIVCEFHDPDHLVMMFTPEISEDETSRVEKALLSVLRRHPIDSNPPIIRSASRVMSVREALLAPSEEIAVTDALGRVLASANVSCPPAVPVAVCGEVLDEAAIEAFRYYGIEKIRVVK